MRTPQQIADAIVPGSGPYVFSYNEMVANLRTMQRETLQACAAAAVLAVSEGEEGVARAIRSLAAGEARHVER